MIFVYTISDIVGLIFLGVLSVIGLVYLFLTGIDKLQRKFRKEKELD